MPGTILEAAVMLPPEFARKIYNKTYVRKTQEDWSE
jgi:hypothetical protein